MSHRDAADAAPAPTPLLISAREAAARLGISERTLWNHTKSGVIPCRRIGVRVLYSVRELEEWISRGCPTGGAL